MRSPVTFSPARNFPRGYVRGYRPLVTLVLVLAVSVGITVPVHADTPPHLVIVDTGYAGRDDSIEVVVTEWGDGADPQGHGTLMADWARRACRVCRITVLDVTGATPTRASALAGATTLAVELGADVIALPHAGRTVWPDALVDEVAAAAAVVPVAAAAGNGDTREPHWPAVIDGVIAVGSDYPSNHGPWVDVVLPVSSTSKASVLHAVRLLTAPPPLTRVPILDGFRRAYR